MTSKSAAQAKSSKRKSKSAKGAPAEILEQEEADNWAPTESEESESWTPVDLRLLLEDFRDGQRFYLEALQDALLQTMEMRVRAVVEFRLGIDSEIGDRGLRKIANSALSAGKSGELRTREAAIEFLIEKLANVDKKVFLKKIDEEFKEDYSWAYPTKKTFDQKTLCAVCDEALIDEKYLLLPVGTSISNNPDDDVYYVHLSCDFANGMRYMGREIRSTRGAYEKQMRSIRQVLKAYYKNPNYYPEGHEEYFEMPDDFLIHNRDEFGNFLFNIYSIWSETTDVNEAFHPVYWSYLNEYAQAIVEFRAKGEISKSTIMKKLRKHIDSEDRIESIYENFVNNYSEALGDTGKAATNPAVYKKQVVNAVQPAQAPFEEDLQGKAGVLHAVVHEYNDDTRVRISEVFREGYPVVLDTSKLPNDQRQKLMDYSAGLIFGVGGEIHQISSTIYLLMPEHATLFYMK